MRRWDISEPEAVFVRNHFKTTTGWDDLPSRWREAIQALPDTTKLQRCNIMLKEMVRDSLQKYRAA